MPLFINKVSIAGNLTKAPELRFLPNERATTSFTVAINHKWKTKDGEARSETEFIDVECWGRTAELVCQYMTKGRNIYLEGRLRLDQWEDKNTGQKRSKIKVQADEVKFVDSADANGSEAAPKPEKAAKKPYVQNVVQQDESLEEPPF
jgi:single-strand DNA-binding protein